MRLVISILPPDFVFDAHRASLCRRLEAFEGAATRKKKASFTRSDLSIILAEIICFLVAKISRIGLLGWVNELQVSPGLSLIGQV
jgi:aspartate aminotransferase-like enzyme